VWFYPVLVAVALALCCAFAWYRYIQAQRSTQDKRTPYEIWVDYHDAKREGRDFVPAAHVVNPAGPASSATLPGHQRRRIFSMRVVDWIGGSSGKVDGNSPTDGRYGGTRRLNPASIYDASGTQQRRISALELNDLYGRGSEQPHNLQNLRALDRLEEANPADLRGCSDDEVAAATAMVSAGRGGVVWRVLVVSPVSLSVSHHHRSLTLPSLTHSLSPLAGLGAAADSGRQRQEGEPVRHLWRLQPPHRGAGQQLQEGEGHTRTRRTVQALW